MHICRVSLTRKKRGKFQMVNMKVHIHCFNFIILCLSFHKYVSEKNLNISIFYEILVLISLNIKTLIQFFFSSDKVCTNTKKNHNLACDGQKSATISSEMCKFYSYCLPTLFFLQDFNHKFFTSFVGQVVVASSQKEFQNHFSV